MEYFSEELIAMRHFETKGLGLFLNYLYQVFSGFGRLVWLPIVWMLFAIFVFAWGYLRISTKPCADYIDAVVFSLSQSVSFSAWSKQSALASKSALFTDIESADQVIHLIAMSQNIFSILMLTLIALALRNRFRL